MQVQTVLTSHDSKSGNGKKGKWTLHIFKAENGESYQTFETNIGNKGFGLLGKPATLEYEPEARGDFTNNVLKGIEPDGDYSISTPEVTLGAPVVNTPVAPTDTTSAKDVAREQRIHRQSALERAILAASHGFYPDTDIPTLEGVVRLADAFCTYFVTGEFSFEDVTNKPAETVDLGFEA